MSSFVSTTTALLMAPAATLAFVFAPAVNTPAGSAPPISPIAALAWAQSNCDANIEAEPSAPRAHSEDLMMAAASYDAMRISSGKVKACDTAMRVAINAARAK